MNYAIETIGLTKKYGAQFGVSDLSLHVPQGKIYGLLGRNGAGKTTAMRMMLNLIRPTNGRVLLFGSEYLTQPNITYQKIGSMIETPGFYENLTGHENLQILARLRGLKDNNKIIHTLETVGLDKEKNKIFSNYSMGMKQRLGIAAAIMHEPKMVILDEPINGLDPIGIHEIRKFLLTLCHEKGVTILLSSHVLNEIEQICEIIGVMHEGRLIKEVDMAELRSRQYVKFTVSNVNAATSLLNVNFININYTVYNNSIQIYSEIDMRGEINQLFVENGVLVTEISIYTEKLEDYFSNLIGGRGIG